MSTFVINIIHRPEMVPEYAEKVTGHGQAENIGRKALLTESLDIFKLQHQVHAAVQPAPQPRAQISRSLKV